MVRKIPDAAIFTKDPDEVLDFRVSWASVMGADVDTIVTGSFTAEAGITKDSEVMTTSYMDVWLSGGTDAEDYEILNDIETASGRTWQRSILIKVIEK